MNIALWIAQVLLALMFIGSGAIKAFNPAKTKESFPWAKDASTGFVVFIGFAELLGGLGVVLPQAIHVATILTPIAAIGLAVIMVLAVGSHAKRKESNPIFINIALLAMAVFVAIGRI